MSTLIKQMVTIGPATQSTEMIADLVACGIRLFRLNTSHSDRETLLSTYKKIKQLSTDDSTLACMIDLQGSKIRLGQFSEVQVKKGEEVYLTTDPGLKNPGYIPVGYKSMHADVALQQVLLIDDGRVRLKVTAIDGRVIKTIADNSGLLSSGKGVNLQGGGLNAGALSDTDWQWIELACQNHIDFVGVSFVRDESDIAAVKKYCSQFSYQPQVIAKIERSEALENLDAIIMYSDGVMVARGDLAVEIGHESVPLVQKKVVECANQNFKPVIVATQMLESMVESSTPTRAEVSDVAHAVMEQASCVMLSSETAVGKHPLAAAQMLVSICHRIEERDVLTTWVDYPKILAQEGAILTAITAITKQSMVKAVVVMTESGNMARLVSSQVGCIPVIGLSSSRQACRWMMMCHGCFPFYFDLSKQVGWEKEVLRLVGQKVNLVQDDLVLVVRGNVNAAHRKTNQLSLLQINTNMDKGYE